MEKNSSQLQKIVSKQLNMAVDISNLKNQVNDLDVKFDKSEKTIDKIYNLLIDDDTTKTKGIVHQVRENTLFRNDLKSKFVILIIVGMGVIRGLEYAINLMFR